MYFPGDDGKTHINVYSQGATKLGRFLSNFTRSPIVTEDGPFASIESLWYWLSCRDDRLRTTWGFEAKRLGRELRAQDWLEDEVFKDKIRKAILIKIESFPKFKEMLVASDKPLTHYYVYNGRVTEVPEADWILDWLEFLRGEFKHEVQQG